MLDYVPDLVVSFKITIEEFYAPLNIEFIYILYNQPLLGNKEGISRFMT